VASSAACPVLAAAVAAARAALRLKTDVVVIGAGQAGLSAAYHLGRRGLPPVRGFVVLDAAPAPGGAWQFRWPSLTLATVNRIHDLPGMRFADAVDAGAGEVRAADAVPRYFAAYERAFALPVYRPVTVAVVCGRGDRLLVETDRGEVSARGLINATGRGSAPTCPTSPGPRASAAGSCTPATTARPPSSPAARGRRRGRDLGAAAARRGVAGDDDHVGDAAPARVPHRPVRRRGGRPP
jgi:glycine/D-amino acid oxidase-like deaminating enzyme